MTIASVFKRFAFAGSAGAAQESLKLERSRTPGLYLKPAHWPRRAPLPQVYPLFRAALYYLFTPAAYLAFQNLNCLVTS
jgi:hypothetical protein